MKALGIILAGGSAKKMKELVNKRAVAAEPVGGSFRAIDFALSNMSNSHIQKVAVLTQYNSRSLNEHLNSSKWWDFGRKNGGLYVFTPTITPEHTDWSRGTIETMYMNLDFLQRAHEPYVVIAQGDGIYKLDYNDVIEHHVEKGADITMVCKQMDEVDDISRFGVVTTDGDGKVTDFKEKPDTSDNLFVNCGIYVIRRRLLIELIEKSIAEGKVDFAKDIIGQYCNDKKIYAYTLTSYWNNISSVESYFKTNMDFLKPEIRKEFYSDYPSIYTKVDDLPPAKYNEGCNVKNSLIASGCIVNGTVENSVIFKKVYIGNGVVIRNSIVLNEVYIGDNTVIENCIVESRSTLPAGTEYTGLAKDPTIVTVKGERYSI